ncbi:hypothetical protein BGZ61DRAFT_487849 [Ilyonectria robusta]|uniref:uncharacterized protein n=1 Tax=Ilyonectria robusta TaxID=1079257 RepID=UPI001E8D28E5|nr:uncharacterized protein BGZ61DRAFT_487849 [Ilyonectria robusta]KAH8650454.1 hypothetical protein BGZ61DRAFT_487849 [Ilyonectria robusta]
MTICKLSQSCEETFDLICAGEGEGSSLENPSETLEREQGRFRVWARNIGALREPTSASSLDSRLQDAPKVQKALADGLEGLLESLEIILGIVKGDLPNRAGAIVVTDAGASVGSTTELNELALDIRSSITDLFRYSVFLRRQQPRGREAPTGAGSRAPDASLDIRHTTDMFPKSKDHPWLAERIGSAIAQRREYIRFRQRHQLKSQPNSERTPNALGADTASTKATTYKESGESVMLPEESQDVSGHSTRTNATSFLTIFNNDGTDELGIFDLERLIFKSVPLKYSEYVECPLCRTIQIFHKNSDWRRHVFTDLQPYVCTFEECSPGLFRTRHEWFIHEMDSHRREWHCPKCHTKVDSQAKLRSHFGTSHTNDIAKSQIEPLLNMCDRPIQHFAPGSCLLCDSWDPEPNTASNSQDFCKHLAQHLQQLALTAIPLNIEGLEIKEEEKVEEEVEGEGVEERNSGEEGGTSKEKEDNTQGDSLDFRPPPVVERIPGGPKFPKYRAIPIPNPRRPPVVERIHGGPKFPKYRAIPIPNPRRPPVVERIHGGPKFPKYRAIPIPNPRRPPVVERIHGGPKFPKYRAIPIPNPRRPPVVERIPGGPKFPTYRAIPIPNPRPPKPLNIEDLEIKGEEKVEEEVEGEGVEERNSGEEGGTSKEKEDNTQGDSLDFRPPPVVERIPGGSRSPTYRAIPIPNPRPPKLVHPRQKQT